MDQIVFVFDLEQLVPLDSVTQIDDSSLDLKLDVIKQAALRITTFCSEAGELSDNGRDLPSVGFKFYSSTEYFSVPTQLSGDWYDLSLESWETIEDNLVEKFDYILSAVRRSKLAQQHVGRKTHATSLSKVLEEVSALYSWDRPALHSPVKKGRKIDQKVGSAVVIVTKLPETLGDLEKFLCSKKKTLSP